LLDGQASISSLVDKAKRDGMRAMAVTDHGNMYGIKEFYNYAEKINSKVFAAIAKLEKEGRELAAVTSPTDEELKRIATLEAEIAETKSQLFKPIIGCECYCARVGRLSKESKEDLNGWHLILLAKSLKGYHNLIKLVSLGWTEGFYGKPRIDKELLERYHEGIIACSACLGGEVPRHIMNGRKEDAEATVLWFKNLFGDDYYLELQRHKTTDPLADQGIYPKQEEVNATLFELAARHGIKVVATNDVHFVNADDAEAHDRLICLSTGKDVDDPARMRYSKQEWLKTTEEMNGVFGDHPEALRNTLEVADKVEFYSINSEPLMPDFPIPEGFADSDEYLRHLTLAGARKRYGEPFSAETSERIDFELETILRMGYSGYFLIVQDCIVEARRMGVAVGPGRGSAAGSVVAYCLGITDIDPIKYDLLFERFLNPDRISMPDIDIDFENEGRAQVFDYVSRKYGKEKVAHIITYGTMAMKMAIKDIARVERLPLSDANRLVKFVPDRLPKMDKISLKDAVQHVPELRDAAASSNPQMRDTLKYAQMLEGNVRNTGVHPCGLIIGKHDISDIVPISISKDKETGEDILVTQYEGSIIEETGLIKMDFLSLKTLSIIKDALENIYQTTGRHVDIDHIDPGDALTYELYCQGRTTGTFQFESAGMQKYLKDLQPSKFEDMIAMNALYRPGPMDYISSFIARRHGREAITYDLPGMERYLRETYGIIIYQEQVMLLSRQLANFTRGESDSLRKAMSKKQLDKMQALKEQFLAGGTANGHAASVLNKIWADWESFASYAFNKSHATCYAWVSFQTAYLKAHYPSEYMAAVLSRSISNISEITRFMDECKSMGIQVLGPDINESMLKFSVNKTGNIRFGLGAIKGVGESAALSIMDERARNGPFKDVYNFVERINLASCNRKCVEALAMAGAFDNFNIHREQYVQLDQQKSEMFIDTLVRYGNRYQSDRAAMSNSLFGDDSFVSISKPEPPPYLPSNSLELLNRERELVGIYLSAHPLDEYRIVLEYVCNTKAAELNELDSLQGREIMLGGIVSEVREGLTKKGKPYGGIKIEDFTGSGEITLFGNDYVSYSNYFQAGLYLLIRGRVESHRWKDGDVELRISSISLLQDEMDKLIEKISIVIPIHALDDKVITEMSAMLKSHPGSSQLYFQVTDGEENVAVSFVARDIRIGITLELIEFLKESSGIEFKIN
jgi:DNA polymerase-3 subunit alpha